MFDRLSESAASTAALADLRRHHHPLPAAAEGLAEPSPPSPRRSAHHLRPLRQGADVDEVHARWRSLVLHPQLVALRSVPLVGSPGERLRLHGRLMLRQ
jgi:hypothetical protein